MGESVAAGAPAAAQGMADLKAANALEESVGKASQAEQFRHNIVMSLLMKMPSGQF
jgi:hypothetical protein